ncbi:hypothetical protein ON010_g15941 [Phytophthora cinnamomi]|nr:hypothetical protein ON010_g15941 [Phytophthora cinnamomi]
MDATFKLNQLSYPVVVCDVSDRHDSFIPPGGSVHPLPETGGAVCEGVVGASESVYSGYWEATSGQIRRGGCGNGSAKCC